MVNGEDTFAFKHALAAEAQRLGFAAFGVTSAAENPVRAARLGAWLEAGMHGQMEWMEGRELPGVAALQKD